MRVEFEVNDEFWDAINSLTVYKEKEIIHCKDCKYWDADNDVGVCINTEEYGWNADDFCSKGERRNDRDSRRLCNSKSDSPMQGL